MMRVFADLAAFEINRDIAANRETQDKHARIRDAIDGQALSVVYQPIWNIDTGKPAGLEALSRFAGLPQRSPDKWFNEAAETGLGTTLEGAAIRMALSALERFPPQAYVSVNASPETILSGEFAAAVAGRQTERIVVEITEHARVDDYEPLLAALAPLRKAGLRLAVDDACAGYSSLQHILHLRPDIIKLDMTLTRSIDLDPARRALALALVGFAHQLNSFIVAEGVETASELKTLRSLGIEGAQGYFLARPMSCDDAAQLFQNSALAARVA
jgi:EAL domain-containing protein (putative c-di-GMP-specific phosphodiesterase class I)